MQTATAGLDLYATLGVAPTASTDEIAAAFRTRAKELHPDLHPGDAAVVEQFKSLTHAYNVLARPQDRIAYDRRRAVRTSSGPGRAAAPGAAPVRHVPLFSTPGKARAAMWGGVALLVAGLGAGGALAGLDTGDSAKTVTLWLVVVKLVACGAILAGLGAWRLARLRPGAGVTAR